VSEVDVAQIREDLRWNRLVLENTRRSVSMGISGMQDQAKRIEATVLALEIKLKEAVDASGKAKGKRHTPRRKARRQGKKAKR